MASPKPHAVVIPYPAQGHVTPLLHLAKVLHSRGFCITYVNTVYNHQRLLRSRGADALDGVKDFHFEAIPDGLPPSNNDDVTQNIPELCISTRENCVAPFRALVMKINLSMDAPPVSCIIADGFMTFTLEVAKELGIPELLFSTTSACGYMAYLHFFELVQRGYTPLKDESHLSNGYLDTPIDWIPGMTGIRLKDIPSFIRTTDPNDTMLNFDGGEAQNAFKAWGVILNTFDELEHEVIDAMKSMFPRLYTIGPLLEFVNEIAECPSKSIGGNLWKEDPRCLEWLDGHEATSVVYVNFGSITVMTGEQLEEFAWGLANSKCPFLWIIRPDLVEGEKAMVPEDFLMETRGRGMLASWCPQEQVLSHPSVGLFLTHSGWNSTLESICGGVPMMCWPFFAEQPTNCRYVCTKWGIGMEIDSNVRREEVEGLVREVMEGEKGKDMRLKAEEWKVKAEGATMRGGSSNKNMERLISDLLNGTVPLTGTDN
ncbi:7-deoxyloganetin glucosyltransferase isoform X2 [Elaeis guineensis]|uniref:Glycosyltransferase n=1 Tax=Elaeis guineensis var. tenera TaxID=51953 RepID=A0A8N4F3E4_ELAGV|nr:7-deoxyloganetin glucosyltransferase isoform X2 [Elaeis guineensis]